MPHLVLTYSNLNSAAVETFQDQAATALAEKGFTPNSIKCYAVKTSHAHIAGSLGAPFAHMTFRMLDKPERTEDVRSEWLSELCEIAATNFPTECTLTAEAVFLPHVYRSVTR